MSGLEQLIIEYRTVADVMVGVWLAVIPLAVFKAGLRLVVNERADRW